MRLATQPNKDPISLPCVTLVPADSGLGDLQPVTNFKFDVPQIDVGQYAFSNSSTATPLRVKPREGGVEVARDPSDNDGIETMLPYGTPFKIVEITQSKDPWGNPSWVKVQVSQAHLGIQGEIHGWMEGHRIDLTSRAHAEAAFNDHSLLTMVAGTLGASETWQPSGDRPLRLRDTDYGFLPFYDSRTGTFVGHNGIYGVENPHRASVGTLPPTHQNVVASATLLLGMPFVWGGNDGSAWAQKVYARVGIELPRNTGQQATMGTEVPFDQVRAGDLVVFKVDKPESKARNVGVLINRDDGWYVAFNRQESHIEPIGPTVGRNTVPALMGPGRYIETIRRLLPPE